MKRCNARDLRKAPKQPPDLPGKKGRPQGMEMDNIRAKNGQGFKHARRVSPTDLKRRTQYLQYPETTKDDGLELSIFARNATRCQHGHHMPGCRERSREIQNVTLNPSGSLEIVGANEQNPHAVPDAPRRLIKPLT